MSRHTPPVLACLGLTLLSAPATRADPAWSAPAGAAGFVNEPFGEGPQAAISVHTASGPRLYIGGDFLSVAGAPIRDLAIYNGSTWSGVALTSSFNAETVYSLTAAFIDGRWRVVVAGQFEAPVTRDGLGYLDDLDTLRPLAPTPISPHIWVGSAFGWLSPNGPELLLSSGHFPPGSDYIYRHTAAGYSSVPPGVITIPRSYALFDDGGGPAVYMAVPALNSGFGQTVTRWNGSVLTPLTVGISWVDALCVHDDGSGTGPALYAGGLGLRRYRDGAWEPVPGAPTFGIRALASFDDGTGPALFAAGQFTSAGGTPINRIARFRAGQWQALGAGITGSDVRALAVYDDDGPGPRAAGLFVVGEFTGAGGIPSPGIARWGPPLPACRADFNGAGGVTAQDLFDFLAAWFADLPVADFNISGGLSVQDVFDFLAAFFAPCS